MKRGADYPLTDESRKKLAHSDASIPDRSFSVFAIVKSPSGATGLCESFEQVKQVKAHCDGGVYKSFPNKAEALEWYKYSLRLTRNPNATEIYTSARNYDVTQERDIYAAVAWQQICLPANTRFSAISLSFLVIFKAISMFPVDQPLRILTDCPRIAYGINYGLKQWPKHDIIDGLEPEWLDLEAYFNSRPIEVDYVKDNNPARKLVTQHCYSQYTPGINTFRKAMHKERMRRGFIWLMCARRMKLNKDIARKIAKLVMRDTSGEESRAF